jgi:hypothetical protein
MPEAIRIVRKYYAIDENRNIVAEGNSWEEVEEIMKKKGYKRSQLKRLCGTFTKSRDGMPQDRREITNLRFTRQR